MSLAPASGSANSGSAHPGVAADHVQSPPAVRTFEAPNRAFVLTIELVAEGAEPKTVGRLHDNTGVAVWQRPMPQYYGPRYAFVADDGRVLMLDEWVPIASRFAVMALARDGSPVAIIGYDNLATILRADPKYLAGHAALGIWLSAAPTQDGETITAPTPAGAVAIDFAGRITPP